MADESVLLADDEPISREFLQEALAALGLRVTAVEDGQAALEALARQDFDLVVTDLKMPRRDGVAVLTESKLRDPDRPVVLVTAHGTLGVAVEALRKGADDILEKPVSPAELELALARVRERQRLVRENRFFREQSVGENLLIAGPAMERIVELVGRIAPSQATILIQGESGTGKERVAALVHRRSSRGDKVFVKLNCAAVPETLLESELFGHEAGAFTGAARRREGHFELADGGTLFLDEVGEMAPAMQSKLLRVLQEGELTRVGASTSRKVDVRVVAATNRNLQQDVKAGRFREDLFYRLNVVPLRLPPLRERREEILPLARHFLAKGFRLDASAEPVLVGHPWPGNVRELQNVIQRACLLCDRQTIDADLLVPWLQPASEIPRPAGDPVHSLVGRPLAEIEERVIQATLTRCGGNRTRAASVLGIGVRTLFNKLRATDPA